MIKLQPFELDALRSYAAEHGRNWKSKLSMDWYKARAIGHRGAVLHNLRNSRGPTWLYNFRFPKD